MGQTLKCISPVDGSVFAEREVLSREDAFAAAERARAAQPPGRHGRCRSALIW